MAFYSAFLKSVLRDLIGFVPSVPFEDVEWIPMLSNNHVDACEIALEVLPSHPVNSIF